MTRRNWTVFCRKRWKVSAVTLSATGCTPAENETFGIVQMGGDTPRRVRCRLRIGRGQECDTELALPLRNLVRGHSAASAREIEEVFGTSKDYKATVVL